MRREIIIPENEKDWLNLRKLDLTSSDIASLFGVGYVSYDTLVQIKRCKTRPLFEENERMQWGIALQPSIANKICKDNQWDCRDMKEYIRIPSFRIGSSFDYEVSWESDLNGEALLQKALLEIKNVDQYQYKKEWLEGFEIEAPPKIELQIQHEMLVSGHDLAYLGVLIGGNKGLVLRREANKKVQLAILEKAERFWGEVDDK